MAQHQPAEGSGFGDRDQREGAGGLGPLLAVENLKNIAEVSAIDAVTTTSQSGGDMPTALQYTWGVGGQTSKIARDDIWLIRVAGQPNVRMALYSLSLEQYRPKLIHHSTKRPIKLLAKTKSKSMFATVEVIQSDANMP